eukprot:m.289559 g.289559  ORF g.289559 m.289559 type:complete len:207 (-) comp27109_c0_seq7:1566-2186(-)
MPPSAGVADVRQFVHEDVLASLYGWLDEIPLSRPKRNITRDFADGVMAAEVIAHFLPRLIETHNYQSCAGRKQKKGNWDTLNKKVLKRFQKLHIPDNVIEAIIAMRPGVVEVVLIHIRNAIDTHMGKSKKFNDPSAYDTDQRVSTDARARQETVQRQPTIASKPGSRRRGRHGDAVTLSDSITAHDSAEDADRLGQDRKLKLPPIQ